MHRHVPTITDFIDTPIIHDIAITPVGNRLAYVERLPDWDANQFMVGCVIHDLKRHETLTRIADVWNPHWLNEESFIALHYVQGGDATGHTDKVQVWLFREAGQHKVQLSASLYGIQRFWPFGQGIIYQVQATPTAADVRRMQRYGTYVHVDHELRLDALFYIPLPSESANGRANPAVDPAALQLSADLDQNLRIQNIYQSLDTLYVNCQHQGDTDATSVWSLAVCSEQLDQLIAAGVTHEKSFRWTQLDLPPRATIMDVAPDGNTLLLNWDGGRTTFYSNEPWDLWTASLADDKSVTDLTCLTSALDRQILRAQWHETGIYIQYLEGVYQRLARLDETGGLEVFSFDRIFPLHSLTLSRDGTMSFLARGPDIIPEVVVGYPEPADAHTPTRAVTTRVITPFSRERENWDWGTSEVIRWASRDGTEIEGILHRPTDFDPNRKYPLIVMIHGGPATASLHQQFDGDAWFYPYLQWLARGILILKLNYRGSDGRGHAFMELNQGNLGTGELWDVESGVDYLIAHGFVDPARVGCAGWSHGGFITAFACFHSDRFAVMSLGAGITDWAVYYATSAFHRFPERVLGSPPHMQPDLYRRASPVSAPQARPIPTLIQHGDEDAIVHVVHAEMLYRSLKTQHVPVEFFRYPGMGHPVSHGAPRVARAVLSQNLKWFCHHLLGHPLAWDEPDDLE